MGGAVSETRTVHQRLDPALRAYFAWCDAEDRDSNPYDYNIFAAGYRAPRIEEETPQLAEVQGP